MVRWLLALILTGALISITGLRGAGAQQLDQVRVSVDTQSYPRLQTTVTVLDSSGRPVTGLDQQAFKVSADDKPLGVTGFTTGQDKNAPGAVTLTFDTSGSMNEGNAIGQAREAGKALVAQLGPTDQVAIVTFSDGIRLVRDFTSDHAAIISAIDGISAAGNTALYDGVDAAVGTANRAPYQRRAIVLLTDGKDEGSVSHMDRAGSLAAAGTAGIPVFAIGLGPTIDQGYLQDLVNVTRGQLFLAPSPEALAGLYQSIGAVLRQQYILDVDASGLDAASAKTLSVEVTHGGIVTSADAPLDLSRFAPTPQVTPVMTPPLSLAPTPVATPAGTGAEGGGSAVPLAIAGGALALGLAGAAGAVYWRRRSGRAGPQELRKPWRPRPEDPGAVFVGTGPLGNMRADAWLESMTPENGARFPLGEDPVTVGFTGDCTICLPDGAGHAGARFRVWRREGVYMLHNLTRMGRVTVGGKPATWAVLEDGDEIIIGPSKLRFRTGNGEPTT